MAQKIDDYMDPLGDRDSSWAGILSGLSGCWGAGSAWRNDIAKD